MKNRFILVIILSGIIVKGASAQVKKDSLQTKNNSIVEKVIESTFKSYPQQAGQPTIIINNIIVPPDYKQPQVAAPEKPAAVVSESKDYEEYRELMLLTLIL